MQMFHHEFKKIVPSKIQFHSLDIFIYLELHRNKKDNKTINLNLKLYK
jgi:hypothetical protein